jgi:hypothetical protein
MSKNGGASQRNCAYNSMGTPGSFYQGRRFNTDGPRDNEIKSRPMKVYVTRVISAENCSEKLWISHPQTLTSEVHNFSETEKPFMHISLIAQTCNAEDE